MTWWLLDDRLPSPSERFYLLVPLTCLGLCLLGPARASLRRLLVEVGYAAVCAVVYAGMVAWPVLAHGSARTWADLGAEVLVFVYFFLALRLLFAVALGGLRGLARALEARRPGRSRERLLLRAAPVTILAAAGIPFFIAALYVHRFKVPNVDPARAVSGRIVEDVAFTAADGVPLSGWFVRAERPGSRRTLVICHGLGANRSVFLPYLAVADALGAHALLFDFRGHGASGGHTVSFGYREKLDVLAAVAFVREHRPAEAGEVLGIGVSMGTCALTLAAAEVEPPLDGVIIDSGFAAAGDLTTGVLADFPWVLRPLLAGPGVPFASFNAGCWLPGVRPVDAVGRLRCPVLFVHSRGDRLISPEQARLLYERAAEPKTLWVADTAGHATVLFAARDAYLETVRRWDAGRAQANARALQ